MHDLVQIENCFLLNVNVYALERKEQAVAKIVQQSPHLFSSTINLNLYENHFSYIKSMQMYTGRYVCPRCSKIWTENKNYHRHIHTCEFEVKHKYIGGVYHTPLTIFERLDEVGIHVSEEDHYFSFRATFDFEAYFQREIFLREQICCSEMQNMSLDFKHSQLCSWISKAFAHYQ